MPLPPSGQSEWPPPGFTKPVCDINRWSAWWSGDADRLADAYGSGDLGPTAERTFEPRELGGIGKLRFFWGQTTPAGQQRGKLHMPLAAEIASVSADLLFGQPPSITVPDDHASDTVTQDRINTLLGEEAHTVLHEAAEAGAALGHTYLRVSWDVDVDPTGPILSAVDADAAFPTYRYGRLQDVTFVREFPGDGSKIYRHLEYHERGAVWNALYLGDHRTLGVRVPLQEHPHTAHLADMPGAIADEWGAVGVETQLDMLDVVGVKNARTRTWRNIPEAQYLGRADISGVEPVLDKLDEAWTSWIRDLRVGKARIHVPQHYLETHGRGKGATFDMDREVYVGVDAMADTEKLQIDAQQFAIRVAEHADTAKALTQAAVSGAGYSPQTFGLDADAALTAMESWQRQSRTQNLRAGKIRHWRPALIQLTRLMLAVDRVVFGGRANPDIVPEVDFADVVSESPQQVAQTVALIAGAEVASLETLVRMQHQDWSQEQVEDEIRKIREDRKSAAPDPIAMFDRHPADDDGEDDEGGAPGSEPDQRPPFGNQAA